MPTSADHPAPSGINRREAIRRAALLAGVSFAPAWLRLVEGGPPVAAQTAYLSPLHRAIVTSASDRILPRTDTPGASDVGVPAFIDLLYGEFMTETERQRLTDGLDGIEAANRAAHGTAFTATPAAAQDDVLRAIARAEGEAPEGFFRAFRSATILGYFTSEAVGRTVLNYDPIPGRYDACVPIDDVGRKNWTT